MFEALHLMAYTYHRDDIEAQFLLHLMLLDISIGSYRQIAHLSAINGFLRPLVIITGTGLHLYHHQGLSIWRKSQDIQVSLTYLPVPVDDNIAFSFKVKSRLVLSPCT